ncbi:hypothetical protein A0H81_08051 [Grifola frondosa]|uniref:Uncharacterized protein n=1 Tax=Grifola frondosa TaxID=5627 RepID=A0A1C7M8J0_GRIFR|nr:hypothetical protein A0H81_08051 [Grifola frondosa]
MLIFLSTHSKSEKNHRWYNVQLDYTVQPEIGTLGCKNSDNSWPLICCGTYHVLGKKSLLLKYIVRITPWKQSI